jgi:nicotinate-nucleotide adenylyltransferase
MRVGLFGGTFNPIHRCHLTLAGQVRDRLSLDQVLFVPAGTPPHKPPASLAPAHHRVAMVREAIADDPTFAVSDIEARRAETSYSIDTVRRLQQERAPADRWFFLIGLDAFLDIATWKDPAQLLRTCGFVVIGRPGSNFIRLRTVQVLPAIPEETLRALDAGAQTRADVAIPPDQSLTLLQLPPCPISASAVRDRIRRGESCGDWLPLPVQSYIMRTGLYKEASDRA